MTRMTFILLRIDFHPVTNFYELLSCTFHFLTLNNDGCLVLNLLFVCMAITEQIFNSICINQPVKEWSDVVTKKTVFNSTQDLFLIMPTCKAIGASWEAVKPKTTTSIGIPGINYSQSR